MMLLRSNHEIHALENSLNKRKRGQAHDYFSKRKKLSAVENNSKDNNSSPHRQKTKCRSKTLHDPRLSKKSSPPLPDSRQAQAFEEDSKPSAFPLNDAPPTNKAPLTEKNLRALTTGDIMGKRKSQKTDGSIVTTTTTTTDKNFGPQLAKAGVAFGLTEPKPPADLLEVEEYIDRKRDSLSPDSEEFKLFRTQLEESYNEHTRQMNVWPLLAKSPAKSKIQGYNTDFNLQWTEVDSLINNSIVSLSDAKPDISESLRSSKYPDEALEALGPALVPTQYGLAMPKLCVEWKGPDGSLQQAEAQSAYDGSLMVEAAHKAHEFMEKPDLEFFDHTQALTIATDGKYLHIYANHATLNGSQIQYNQYQVCAEAPVGSKKQFQNAYRRVRNVQDWARERTVKMRDELKSYVEQLPKRPEVLSTAQAIIDGAETGLLLTPPDTVPTGSTDKTFKDLKRTRT